MEAKVSPKHLSPEDAERYEHSIAVRHPFLIETMQKIIFMAIALMIVFMFSAFAPSLSRPSLADSSRAFGDTAQVAVDSGVSYDAPDNA